MSKKNTKETTDLKIQVPEKLKDELKLLAMLNKQTMKDYLVSLIEAEINKNQLVKSLLENDEVSSENLNSSFPFRRSKVQNNEVSSQDAPLSNFPFKRSSRSKKNGK